MVKQYITWQTFWLNNQEGRHIDANITKNWGYKTSPIVCECLGYGNTSEDKRMIATIDIPDTYSDSVIDRLFRSLDVFAVEKILPAKALELVLEWYGKGSFKLTKGVLVDLRPKEEL